MGDRCFASLPVTFQPHWAEVRMLWLPGASIVVSLAVGIVAVWNGLAARNTTNRLKERQSQESIRATRVSLALAMIRAINAVDTTSSKATEVKDSGGRSFGPNPLGATARQEEDSRVDEALALISVTRNGVDPIEFRNWFLHMIRHMRGYSVYSKETLYEPSRNDLLEQIAIWNNDPTQIGSSPSLDFKGKLGSNRNLDACAGDRVRD